MRTAVHRRRRGGAPPPPTNRWQEAPLGGGVSWRRPRDPRSPPPPVARTFASGRAVRQGKKKGKTPSATPTKQNAHGHPPTAISSSFSNRSSAGGRSVLEGPMRTRRTISPPPRPKMHQRRCKTMPPAPFARYRRLQTMKKGSTMPCMRSAMTGNESSGQGNTSTIPKR